MTTLADPFLVGTGPATFSTSLEIARRYPPIVWDVNGYYRELGVRPDATKTQIKWAYRKKRGWRSPRLTYIMKQLLNPSIRAAYDSTPLGEVFWDAYVEEAMRQAAQKRISELRGQGRNVEADSIAEEWDSPFSDPDDKGGEGFDKPSLHDHDHPSWPWAYYLWQTGCQDTERLRGWQEALCGVLGERKEHVELAVGFLGGVDRAWEVRTVGYRIVAFLSDGAQPTEVLAKAAASRVMEMAHNGP